MRVQFVPRGEGLFGEHPVHLTLSNTSVRPQLGQAQPSDFAWPV